MDGLPDIDAEDASGPKIEKGVKVEVEVEKEEEEGAGCESVI